MRVTSVPVMPAEGDSPHALGAMGIRKGRTYRESRKSGRSVTGLFCLFGITPEFWYIFNLVNPSVERQSCIPSGVEKVTG